MENQRLSENFTLNEFLKSETADRNRISNRITVEGVGHLKELCQNLLQPLREAWGSGIVVSSGWRSKALNKAVGGVPTSAHLTGYAADLVPANGRTKDFIEFAVDFFKKSSFKYDQIIKEKSGKTLWLHIGYKNSAGLQRKQILNIEK